LTTRLARSLMIALLTSESVAIISNSASRGSHATVTGVAASMLAG